MKLERVDGLSCTTMETKISLVRRSWFKLKARMVWIEVVSKCFSSNGYTESMVLDGLE
jgi:hypothetical protein